MFTKRHTFNNRNTEKEGKKRKREEWRKEKRKKIIYTIYICIMYFIYTCTVDVV